MIPYPGTTIMGNASHLSSGETPVRALARLPTSRPQIAGRLHISAKTERNHVASILAKLDVHSRLQALVFAARHGVVEIGGPRGEEDRGL
jgi:DNA-binding NarL/FixJ family response regulator